MTGWRDGGQPAALRVERLDATADAAAGALLARSFDADPFPRWMLPDAEERARVLPWHYQTLVRIGLLAGEVSCVGEPLAGVAVWLLRADASLSLDVLERAGMLDAPRVFGSAAFARYSRVVGQLDRLRRRDVPGAHWYLAAIGVDVERQGAGLGAALVAPRIEASDREGLSCYLESFQPRNYTFYERLGFAVQFDGVEPHSGLPVRTFARGGSDGGGHARPPSEREAPW